MHTFPVTIYYDETDLGGIVYHANYLRFIDRARTDWVGGLGIDQNAMRAAGTIFVVHRIEADFRAPARLDDRLVITTRPLSVSSARLVLDQQVLLGDCCLFQAKVTIVCITTDGKPRRLPPALRTIGENA
ncbi:tol-pal system-associated acyl-CoA thioesterase [Pararhodobacter zhoushanensis]|uniref:tol-pal system-associated acyl-CoA thioesterase n=1 Tax=Pararhodobacter zhoushanensis TaxID=2479545 RepID=UPI000F8DF012|nr:tol-pal system-associated acyl-CoA thioesterase [Pararhodobacter zhoushanensis]